MLIDNPRERRGEPSCVLIIDSFLEVKSYTVGEEFLFKCSSKDRCKIITLYYFGMNNIIKNCSYRDAIEKT